MSITTPSRRGLLAASAWAVPSIVVASAAPAFASSTDVPTTKVCTPVDYLFSWSAAAFSYQSANSSVPAGTGNGAGVGYASLVRTPIPGVTNERLKVTVANTFSGNAMGLVNSNGKNMVVPTHNVGGLNHRGLEMYQGNSTGRAKKVESERSQDAQTVVVTFDRAVTGLSFTITDIDAYNGQYADRVELLGMYTATHPGTVTGEGTQAQPWRGTGGNVDHITSGQGNVKVTFNGPVTSFALKFWNAEDGSRNNSLNSQGAQAIFLSNFNFRASSCLTP